jgi:hypothetical protein
MPEVIGKHRFAEPAALLARVEKPVSRSARATTGRYTPSPRGARKKGQKGSVENPLLSPANCRTY